MVYDAVPHRTLRGYDSISPINRPQNVLRTEHKQAGTLDLIHYYQLILACPVLETPPTVSSWRLVANAFLVPGSR